MNDITKEDVENGLDLLWAYTQEAEGNCSNDPVLKNRVSQTYDYFNRVGYTENRPRWEFEETLKEVCGKGYRVNHKDDNAGGTSLAGYIDISYDELVEKLGESGTGFDDYKCDAEWIIGFPDGNVATIYNYKSGKNYNGAEGLELEEIRDWHIGGNSKDVVAQVHKIFGK